MQNIKRVIGAEPHRPDENPKVISVGFDRVVKIEERTENLGSYGILWFEGFDHQDNVVAKMNGLHVAFVER